MKPASRASRGLTPPRKPDSLARMKHSVTLRCLAPDGAAIREGEFPSVESAWNRAQDMGSRWFFYPVSIITGPATSDRARIIDTPRELRAFKGKTLGTLRAYFAARPDMVAAWLNGEAPFLSPYPYAD